MSVKGSSKFYKITCSTLPRAVLDVKMIVKFMCLLLAICVSVAGAVSFGSCRPHLICNSLGCTPTRLCRSQDVYDY